MSEDLSVFIDTCRRRAFFSSGISVTVTRAPGRLDVMGGIADYSGSLVLQRPIAEATFVALQQSQDSRIEVLSQGRAYSIDLSQFMVDAPRDYRSIRELFARHHEDHWASYVVGAFIVLAQERGARFRNGARILISSAVPEGKGVASSAALEVATMSAIASSFDIPLQPHDLALLCQMVENVVAGAPCGIMDQMTSVFGEQDSLLALLCQPAVLQPSIKVPREIAFWGVDSGERHAVGGSSYESVRAGAFMGRRIIAALSGRSIEYLANVTPPVFERDFASLLPREIRGEEFLSQYGQTGDAVTSVVSSRTYKVKQPTAHPVYENARVNQFRELLSSSTGEQQWTSMGELMYQSHASYAACGLGSPGTDSIVELVRSLGHDRGLYGARITGGGSGGTVAVLGRADAGPVIASIAERYREKTGYMPLIFSGASSGALMFGAVNMNL
jgi:L-arabinokinase